LPSRAEQRESSAEAAVEAALRALRHRDRSLAQLDAHLEERGFADTDRAEALATLTRTGLADDARFASSRARALAERGAGDAYIRHDLRAAAVDDTALEQALAELEPEAARAERVVSRRGRGQRTARYLAAKGFSEDAVYAVVARADEEPLG
jgi:SOS response regulatory protein OraA/RecX